jgi:hypothetical protein
LRYRFAVNPSLPKLSWVADVSQAEEIVSIQHGPFVEVRDRFFIEGVWNGEFEVGDFAATDCIFGSGAILGDRSVLFVSSASTTDYLYYQRSDKRVVVSNSLPLLLSYIDDSLDPHFTGYPRIHYSITEGIEDYIREIPTLKGSVMRLMYRNLEVSPARVAEVEKDMPPRFHSFEDYYSYVVENYRRIVNNSRDPNREILMQIFSTQSKGYDSTAVNAIAAKFGIDKVFTVSKGKNSRYLATNDASKQVDDDGSAVCKAIGLDCIVIDRRSFAKEFDQEYLYYAGLHANQDANLKEINSYISTPTLLLTGTLGELWYTVRCMQNNSQPTDSELRRWDLGGHGLAEIRLVVGFVHLPLPYIGARRREDIVRITESPEMEPWRLGTSYDRPIPRRIAEEAGIPRDLFGQVKTGSVVLFPQPSVPYGKQRREDFFDFLVREGLLGQKALKFWPFVLFVNRVLSLRSEKRYPAVYYSERIISKLFRKDFRFKPLWRHLDGSLFCFCVNKFAQKYASCFREKNRITSQVMLNRHVGTL